MASLADNVARAIAAFDNIKTVITEKGVTIAEGEPVEVYPDKISKVYDNAYNMGMEQSYSDGKQAQYEEIRDIIQDYGNRTNYSHFFNNPDYLLPWYKPKYDIRPTSLYMFTYGGTSTLIDNLDWVEWFEEAGVEFDTSNCTSFQYGLMRGVRWGVIDTRATSNLTTQVFFFNQRLHTIDKLIIKEDGTTKFGEYTFSGCYALENLIIEGVVGTSGLTLVYCKVLSKDSILSIFSALSEETEGLTVTFNKTAINNAFGINVDDETTYTDEWKELTAAKSNWTIAFATV